MATDATGTPTSLGIPTYNTAVDAPSGLGFNATMAAIDTIITARQLPTATGSNKVPVWNGASWVAQTVPPAAVTPGSSGQVLGTNPSGATTWLAGAQLIFDQTLGVTTASFDTNPTSLTGYSQLLVLATTRTDAAVTSVGSALRLNGDAGANYDAQKLATAAATTTSSETFAATFVDAGNIAGASAPAGLFSTHTFWIPNYRNATMNKAIDISTTLKFGTGSGSLVRYSVAGFWRSNAAVDRVILFPSSGANLVAGSRLTIYGLG